MITQVKRQRYKNQMPMIRVNVKEKTSRYKQQVQMIRINVNLIMKGSLGDKYVVHQPNNLFTHDREVEAVSPPRRSPQNQMQDHAFEKCRCCPCHVGKVDLIGKDFLAEMNKKDVDCHLRKAIKVTRRFVSVFYILFKF